MGFSPDFLIILKAFILQNINSLSDLLSILPKCKNKDFKRIVSYLQISESDLAEFATWDSTSYTRNCIDRTDDYELLLLCWEEGQVTDIHCHGGEECWVYLAKGKLHEKRFNYNDELSFKNELIMEKEGLSYMNDELGYHSLHNIAKGRSMSLHLYVGPIDECTIYDEDEEDFVVKSLSYDTENSTL